MEDKKRNVTIQLEASIIRKIDAHAKKHDRSRKATLERLIKQCKEW